MNKDLSKYPEIGQLIHDLRGPLTNIKLTHELLLAKKLGELTELQQEMLETASEDCNKLEKLMENFLSQE